MKRSKQPANSVLVRVRLPSEQIVALFVAERDSAIPLDVLVSRGVALILKRLRNARK